MSALRLVVIGSDAEFGTAIREVLAAQLPEAASETINPAQLRTRPFADGAVIDGRAGGATGAELAARLRAMGFAGALVVVSDEAGADAPTASPGIGAALRSALGAAGSAHVSARELPTRLVLLIGEELERAKSEHAPQVMRARRLIAAGEIALGFQHSLNNPLAGILAEAQLLQMESADPEQHEALERIVVLCRRIMELGKALDGMGERK